MFKKKVILLSLLGLISFASHAQFYQSPYSALNLGDLINDIQTIQQGMGGIGIAVNRPSYIPLYNASLLVNSQLVRFEANYILEEREIQDAVNSITNSRLAIGGIHASFPIFTTKWVMSLGLQPMTNRFHHSSKNLNDLKIDEYTVDLKETINHSGGLTSLYIANGFKVYKGFNLGLKTTYIFGDLNLERESIPATEDFSFYKTSVEVDTNLGDFIFEGSASYEYSISERKKLDLGLIYEFGTDLSATDILNTHLFTNSRITPLLTNDRLRNKRTINYPSTLGTGISYSANNQWLVGFDFRTKNWENADYDNYSGITYRIANSYHLGFEYIPKFDDINSYLKRVIYRGGIAYKQSPWLINGIDVDEINYSVGLSLPLQHYSLLNLGFTVGSRGRITDGLVKEVFYRFSVSINYNDRWFLKRVIN